MVSDFAREIKFLAGADRAPALHAWMRTQLQPDLHGRGAFDDRYEVSSLYFETAGFDVFHRHASYGRSKYRIRRYDDSNTTYLERKFRTSRLLAKRRTAIPLADLERLNDPHVDPGWAGWWFHRRVTVRQLKPIVQISYERIARVGASSEGPIRMTVDRCISVVEAPRRQFQSEQGVHLLEGHSVVELKFQRVVPALFKGLIGEFGLETQLLSKYRMGVTALRLTS